MTITTEMARELLGTLTAQPPPLRIDGQGAVRVGQTRVTLDTVIGAFTGGCSAEEIVRKYPSLDLANVYAVITYYLWHREAMEAYLEQRRQEAEEIRRDNQRHTPPPGLRERLLARRPVPTPE